MTFYVGEIPFESVTDAKLFCDLNKLSQTLVDKSPLKNNKIKAMTTLNLPCMKIEGIDDKLIMSKVPAYVMEMLGEVDGSGFHLDKNERDLFFVNGRVSYVLGTHSIKVEFD